MQEAFEKNLTRAWTSFADIVGTVDSSKTYQIQNRGYDTLVALESTGEPAVDNQAGDLILANHTALYKKGTQDLYLRAFNQNCSINITSYESGEVIVINNQDITVTENGVYTADEGYTGLGTVTVEVEPNIESLSITPSTSAQTITASGGVDGYSPINVSAVTSSIDANIVAGNIKDGVTILGVTGDYTGGGSAPAGYIPRETDGNGVYGTKTSSFTFELPANTTSIGNNALTSAFANSGISGNIDFSSVTTIGDYGLSNAFFHCSNLTSVDLSNVASVGYYGMEEAFNGCSSLTSSVDLSSLTTAGIFGLHMAFLSTGITGINLSSLTSVSDYGLQEICKGCRSLTSVDLSSITSVGESGLKDAFNNCSYLTSMNLSNVTSVGDEGLVTAFSGCSRLTSINLSSVTSIGYSGLGNAFLNCRQLTSVDLSSVTSIGAEGLIGAFFNCSGLTSINLSNVTTVSDSGMQGAFFGCTSLTSVDLSSLETIEDESTNVFDGAFSNSALTTLSFPALKEQAWWSDVDLNDYGLFTNMLEGVRGCTVHFPSNLQTALGSIDNVVNGFGGTNTTVLFDLPSTE